MRLLRWTILLIGLTSMLTAFSWDGRRQEQVETMLVMEDQGNSLVYKRLGLVVEGSNEFHPLTGPNHVIISMGHSQDKQWLYYTAYDYALDMITIPEALPPTTPQITYRLQWGTVGATPQPLFENIWNVVWSKDHEWLIYAQVVDQSIHVFYSRADGSDTRDLTPDFEGGLASPIGSYAYYSPIFLSPDEQWVYFSYRMGSVQFGPATIYRVGIDGQNVQTLAADFKANAFITYLSQGGDWLLFNANDNDNGASLQTYIMKTDGTTIGPFIGPFYPNSFQSLPGGELTPLGSKNVVLFLPKNGGYAAALSFETGQYLWPMFSVSGMHLSPDQEWLYYYPVDSETTIQMRWDGTSKQERPELERGSIVGWSSDGQSILFTRHKVNTRVNPAIQYFELRRLTNAGQDEYIRDLPVDPTASTLNCTWAEDGQSCVFFGMGDDPSQLSLYRLGRDGEYLKRYISWANNPASPDYVGYSYIADGPMITRDVASKESPRGLAYVGISMVALASCWGLGRKLTTH